MSINSIRFYDSSDSEEDSYYSCDDEAEKPCHTELALFTSSLAERDKLQAFIARNGAAIEKRLSCPNCTLPMREQLHELFTSALEHLACHEKELYPVFRRNEGKARTEIVPPQVDFLELDLLNRKLAAGDLQKLSEYSSYFYSPVDTNIPPLELTDENLKKIAQVVYQDEMLQLYTRENGCAQRATYACHLLLALGIPENQVVKCYYFPRKNASIECTLDGEELSWDYHVTAGIKSSVDETRPEAVYVFDGAVESSNYLKLDEWVNRLDKRPLQYLLINHRTKESIGHLRSVVIIPSEMVGYYDETTGIAEINYCTQRYVPNITAQLFHWRVLNTLKQFPDIREIASTYKYFINPLIGTKGHIHSFSEKHTFTLLKKLEYSYPLITASELDAFSPILLETAQEREDAYTRLIKYRASIEQDFEINPEEKKKLKKAIDIKLDLLEKQQAIDPKHLERQRLHVVSSELQLWKDMLKQKPYSFYVDGEVINRLDKQLSLIEKEKKAIDDALFNDTDSPSLDSQDSELAS